MTDQPDSITTILVTHPLFANLPAETLDALVHSCLVTTFPKGQKLIEENQIANELFIILKGQASVVINSTEVGCLCVGDLAGEISSAGISPPIADVVAATEVETLAISRVVLNDIAAEDESFKKRLRQVAFSRIQS